MKQWGIIRVPSQVLSRIEAIRPFTEAEAWGLFRLAALGEAVGWTILILGVLIRDGHGLGSGIAVPIAGRIHGTLFIVYFGTLLATYTSLRWSRHKLVIALLVGVPPYGTFVFEQIEARRRQNKFSRQHYRSILLAQAAGNI